MKSPRLILSTLIAALLIAPPLTFAMKPDNAIVARKSVMKVIGLNFGPMGQMVKGKIPFDKTVFAANALRVKLVADMSIEHYFPKGSEQGKDTTVKPAIWADWETFKAGLKDLRNESAKLADVAATGDEGRMRSQFLDTAKTCKSCHDDFREK